MKRMIFLCVLSVVSQIGLGQAPTDTAVNQQKRIAENISQYIGQPFSVLYNDLTVKPKTVAGIIDSKNKFVEWAHEFYYEVPDSVSDTYIYIEWQTPPLKTETKKYQSHLSVRNFNVQEYPTYKDLIISKLELYPDPNSTPPPPIGSWIVVSSVYKKVLVDGLYQRRYEITKKYCNNGILGAEAQVSHSTTNVPLGSCTVPLE